MKCDLWLFLFLASISLAGLVAGLTTKIPPVEESITVHFAQKRFKVVGLIAAVGGAIGAIGIFPRVLICVRAGW
jgi:hypothetical protein